jgi:predicted MFS family arabinose efflux permease
MDPPPRAPAGRLLSGPFVALTVAELGYFAAAGLAIFVLPLFATGPLGSNEAGAGLAFGAFSVTALLLRPYAGRLADVVGRRPMLLGGASLAAASMFAHQYAESLAVVVVLRLVLGVAEAAFFVAGFAMVADLAPPERMGEALSYNSLGLYLGLALGPLLGELLVRTGGYDTAWSGGAGLCVASALVVLVLVPETGERGPHERGPHEHAALIHRPAVAPSIAFAGGLAAVFGFLSLVTLRAEELAVGRPSLALFCYGLVVVVCRVAFAKVPDRHPPLTVACLGLLGIGAGLTLTAATANGVLLIVATAVVGVGVAFMTPAFFSAIFATAGPRQRGAASGTAALFMDLGFGGGPMLLGVVAAGGRPGAFAVGAGIAVAAALWTQLRPLAPVAA